MTKIVIVGAAAALTAQVAHAVNRAYCLALGDASQPDWEDAPEWQRESAVAGVEFKLQNAEAGPEQSHESWLAQKEKDGWVYGDVKDAEKKTHPCMKPYDELPVEQRVKDHLFIAVVRAVYPLLLQEGGETLDGLTSERDGLAAALETANEELEALRGAIAAKDAAMAKLQKKAKVAQAERKAGKLRDFSKVAALGGGADRAALAELIAGADRVELVLTRDGKEASKLRPFEIAGNPWVLGAAGLRLTLPLDLAGSFDAGAVTFDGYGLIVDGELVAHRARGDKVSLAPGQQMRLVDDVIF